MASGWFLPVSRIVCLYFISAAQISNSANTFEAIPFFDGQDEHTFV